MGCRSRRCCWAPSLPRLGKEKESGFSCLELLDRLPIVYQEILAKLAAQGVEWVQIDEPALALTCRMSGAWPTSRRMSA